MENYNPTMSLTGSPPDWRPSMHSRGPPFCLPPVSPMGSRPDVLHPQMSPTREITMNYRSSPSSLGNGRLSNPFHCSYVPLVPTQGHWDERLVFPRSLQMPLSSCPTLSTLSWKVLFSHVNHLVNKLKTTFGHPEATNHDHNRQAHICHRTRSFHCIPFFFNQCPFAIERNSLQLHQKLPISCWF